MNVQAGISRIDRRKNARVHLDLITGATDATRGNHRGDLLVKKRVCLFAFR
jgi:hypothetical protein